MVRTCVVCGFPFGKSTFPGGSTEYCSQSCGTRWGAALLASPARGPARCGTRSGYNLHRRRGERACEPCREAVREDWRRRADAADLTRAPHGTVSAYSNWGCRCEPCRHANTKKGREYHAKRKAREQPESEL